MLCIRARACVRTILCVFVCVLETEKNDVLQGMGVGWGDHVRSRVFADGRETWFDSDE